MKVKELEMKLRDTERERDEFREGNGRIESDFTRKLKDLEEEIIRRDARERKLAETERDQLSQELLKVEEDEKLVSQEEAEELKKKKTDLASKLKGINDALERLRVKKHQMDVDKLEYELKMKEQKLKEGEERLQNALEVTKEQSEKDRDTAQEETSVQNRLRIAMVQEKEELEKARRSVLDRVRKIDDQVQTQIIRQKNLEIMLFEKKVKSMEDKLSKMKDKEKDLQTQLQEDWVIDDDLKEDDDLFKALNKRSTSPDSEIQKEKEEVDKKREEMYKKMLEMEDQLKKGRKERDGALLRKRQHEVSTIENRIKNMSTALEKVKSRTQRLSTDASALGNGDDDEFGEYESDDEISRSMDARSNRTDSSPEEERRMTNGNGGNGVSIGSQRKRERGGSVTSSFGNTSLGKIDILVEKLDKLDKLDDLLKKLNNMNSVAAQGTEEDKKSYADLKAEMESLQKIIFDENATLAEREDANIRFEKVFTELSNTAEYKAELQQIEDEKRKLNEPLNKAALEKMTKRYSPESLRKNEDLRERLKAYPELLLIGADPRSILAKHQNDFGQYFLRNLELDELRAIRASLPKFRRDQKKQQEWTESLDGKIEQQSKEPEKRAPPPPRPAPSNGGPPPLPSKRLLKQKMPKTGFEWADATALISKLGADLRQNWS